jgi:Mlc titration factor MtfA (ptsG expression regulator)/Tfp pilus assembly protein PilF
MVFPFVKHERRRELLARPFPESWHEYLQENVLLYRLLSEPEQATLQGALRIFFAEKNWEGCAGLTVTTEMELTISAQACLLVLGFEDYYFDEVSSVLIYPGSYLAEDETTDQFRYMGGEAHGPKGPVVLSWSQARRDACRPGRSNLVLHEFAHVLNALNDLGRGVPPIEDPDLLRRWEEVTRAEYQRLVEDASYQRPTLLHHYGASSRAEFFAVGTECFFQQPLALRRRHPELYQVFAAWYCQDPAGRPHPGGEEVAASPEAEQEDLRRGLAECMAVIRRHPDSPDSYCLRAAYHSSLGEHGEALADYGEAIRLEPDDAELYCNRGEAYLAAGRADEAITDFTTALRLCPGFGRAYCGRGIAHVRKGDVVQALADFDAAVRADSKDDAALGERGLLHYDRGDYRKALRDFSRALRLCPYRADVYENRALTFLATGEYDQAVADCDEALALRPDLPGAYLYRGVAHHGRGEYDKALADCSDAIRLAPEWPEAYRARADAYDALGEPEDARQDRALAEELAARQESIASGPTPPL